MKEYLKKGEKYIVGFVFLLYLSVTSYKLTNAPLWFDETIEYWFSKNMFGELPFESVGTAGSVNMYQRIISTFQPPLYNFVMHFWLKFGDGEWWFRFFGVAMGFLGMIAVFKTVKKIGNAYIASMAVFFCSFVYQLVYYWQECAEYCLMLASLFWTIYFWFRLMEQITPKNIILFTVSAIIPVYSQYGAAWAVAGMIVAAYIYVLRSKNKTCIMTVHVSYAAALIVFALPLYFLFLKKQMLIQQRGEIALQAVDWNMSLLHDMIHNFKVVFQWNFAASFSDAAINICIVVSSFAVLFVLFAGKNNVIKTFVAVNIFTWLIYYFSVKTYLYAYGSFGNRYHLFLIPMWIILFFAVGINLYQMMADRLLENKNVFPFCFAIICACFIFGISFFSWNKTIKYNWDKENIRGAVEAWYAQNAETSNTIVYYAADSGFSYYVKINDNYTEQTEDNVNYMPWYREKSPGEYLAYVKSIYQDVLPGEIYIVGSHTRDNVDFNALVDAIISEGYGREDLFSSNAYLVRLTKTVGE